MVLSQLHTILHNQKSGVYGEDSMFGNWNLGTWNIVRVFLMYMSAVPDAAAEFGPFVVEYVHHAQQMMLAKGWRPEMQSLVCTGPGSPGNGNGFNVVGGGHCTVRYPDWLWILQEMVEAPYLQPYINATARTTIMEHMQSSGEWGTDFTTAYGTPCGPTTNRTSALPAGCSTKRGGGPQQVGSQFFF